MTLDEASNGWRVLEQEEEAERREGEEHGQRCELVDSRRQPLGQRLEARADGGVCMLLSVLGCGGVDSEVLAHDSISLAPACSFSLRLSA